jgi:DNA-directed RNA polymerase specialized sigma subunit
MNHHDYEHYKERYKDIQKRFDEALDRQEEMINKSMVDVKILSEIESLRALLQDRDRLRKSAEDDLRRSKDVEDVIYVMRYIDGLNPDIIADHLGYSRSQVYRILQNME